MGVRFEGCSDVTVEGVAVRDCWGDGIYVGNTATSRESQRVTITACTVRNNRRQGLSIVGCIGAVVENSEFSDTNGTAPESGIDLEPNPGYRVTDVTIRNCVAARNKGYGILLYGGAASSVVSGNKVLFSQCTDNSLDGAALLQGPTLSHFEGNTLQGNANNGIQLIASSQNEFVSNTFRDNGGANPLYASLRLANGSSDNTISSNSYLPAGALPEVALITPDCVNNRVA
jgi:parallel beta-helix repeat protein